MKKTTAIALLCALATSACQSIGDSKPDEPENYALLRLRHAETRIEMLTIMQTYGQAQCNEALAEFTKAVYAEGEMEGWRETERSCDLELKPLHQRVFNNEQVHATYLRIAVREGWDYESRIILYGIPSAQAQEVCGMIAQDLQKKLQATTECVQGTV